MTNTTNIDQVVEFIAATVRKQHELSGRRVNGVNLAEAFRHEFPNLTYASLGVERLADLVRIAENKGLLVRHRDVSHLEVSPVSPSNPQSHQAGAGQPNKAIRPSGPVRADIWRAFLFFNPGEARFFDRETSQILEASGDTVDQYRQSPRYIQLNTIPTEIQKGWMREFVREHSLEVGVDAIESATWYSAFPAWLRSTHPDLGNTWGSYRAQKVVRYTHEWAEKHKIPVTQVLSPAGTRLQSQRYQSCVGLLPSPADEQDAILRTAILAALADLPLSNLMDIPIPLRHLMRYFKAR